MSATNRGTVRRAYDFYETPEEVTREFLFEHFEDEHSVDQSKPSWVTF